MYAIDDGETWGDLLVVAATSDGVRVHGEDGWLFDSAQGIAGLCAVLVRAHRQYEHLKSGAGEPLTEEQEAGDGDA